MPWGLVVPMPTLPVLSMSEVLCRGLPLCGDDMSRCSLVPLQ